MKAIRILFCTMLLAAALSSCKVYAPEFKRIENVAYNKIDREGFKLSGDIVFYNPNKYNFTMHEMLMDVSVDGKRMATGGQLQTIVINKNSEFIIPLDLIVKPEMTFIEGFKALINIFKTKMVDVTIEGTVVVKAMGIKIPVTVLQTQKVDVTKLR